MSTAGPPALPPEGEPPRGRAIVRAELREIIRRAAELTFDESDAHELLTEDEVLRIATELGLPAHHVQRALYELPELRIEARWYDRYFGPAVLSNGCVVHDSADVTLRRIEDYLVTREYLQIARRRNNYISFTPAEDTLSKFARALVRRGRRHAIARASRVVVGVHALPDSQTHVRFDVDLSEARSDALRTGAVLGTLGGTVTGTLAAMATVALLPETAGVMPVVTAFGAGLVATSAAGIALAANSFRERMNAAKLELASLLDRMESGERLDPPAPWRRKLHLKLFGDV